MVRDGCSLLVRNLRFETPPEKIRAIFEECGRVRDVYLPLDHDTRKPRGFGFVEFYENNEAMEAMRTLDRTVIDGNEISVILAQDRRKSPETMRRLVHRGRGGGGGGMDGPRGPRGGYDRPPRGYDRGYGRSRSRSPRGYPPRRDTRYRSPRREMYDRRGYDEPRNYPRRRGYEETNGAPYRGMRNSRSRSP